MKPCTPSAPKICELEILVDGFHGYDVSITTGDDLLDATTIPIHFSLVGDKAKGQEMIITEKGFKAGQLKTITYYTKEIGTVQGFEAFLEGKGKWQPIKVTVVDLSIIINKI